jgi:2-oxoglutarate/2-oxoacid ferredoxin oxidoreductase subunit alpha
VEQNRDAQLRGMIVNELNIDPARVMPILHYDGTPITARFITQAVGEQVRLMNVEPLKKGRAA